MDKEDYYLRAFFDLLAQPRIQDFVHQDKCRVIADNYLLATVFILFRRAGLTRSQYNRKNFYLALYLSHDLNEDVEDFKDQIIESYLGSTKQYIRKYYEKFLEDRFALLVQIKYNGYVNKLLCDNLMLKHPHWAWSRIRNSEHTGVFYKHCRCQIC